MTRENKEAIIIIDSDMLFFEEFGVKLESQLLDERFQIKPIIPQKPGDPGRFVDECISEVQKIMDCQEVALVFVDIVIHHGKTPLDTSGISIANALRQRFPDVLIYPITGYISESEIWAFCHASFEDVDGVIAKQYLTHDFSAESLRSILTKGKKKRQKRLSKYGPHCLDGKELETVEQGYSIIDIRVQNQIERITKPVFYSLLSRLFPHGDGVILYVRPGFSGSFLFKLCVKIRPNGRSPTKEKWWVMKVDKDFEKIEKEFQEYGQIKQTPLGREHYPPVLDVLASCDNWAAIAMEAEEETMTLIDYFVEKPSSQDLKLDKLIGDQLGNVLECIYGDSISKASHVWVDFYGLKPRTVCNILSFIQNNRTILEESIDVRIINKVCSFVKGDNIWEENIYNLVRLVETKTIHGDLNSRNILLHRDTARLVLIDFAKREQDHIVKDIAKLETDALFLIMDASSRQYYSWERVSAWKKLFTTIRKPKLFELKVTNLTKDEAINKIVRFVCSLRRLMKILYPKVDEVEYLLALLHFSLSAISYPDVSIHKKAFGLLYANEILERLTP